MTNIGQKDFTIDVTDTCETPTLTASSLSDEVYTINSGAQATPAFVDFLDSPTYCPISYTIAVTPTLPASSTITLDASTRIVTFDSINPQAAGDYTVTITCVTPQGADTGQNFSFVVTFEDPCDLATLTIDPSTLTGNPYTYEIAATADVQTFDDAYVTSSYAQSSAICPTDYVFTVTKRNGDPLDASLFTFEGSGQTLTTYTTEISYFT